MKPLVLSSMFHKRDAGVHTSNLSTPEMEARGWEFQDHLQLHSEFKASLGCMKLGLIRRYTRESQGAGSVYKLFVMGVWRPVFGPYHPYQSQVPWRTAIIPALGKLRLEDPWGLLAGQSSQIRSSEIKKKKKDCVSKSKMERDWGRFLLWMSCFHIHCHTCTHERTHTHRALYTQCGNCIWL